MMMPRGDAEDERPPSNLIRSVIATPEKG